MVGYEREHGNEIYVKQLLFLKDHLNDLPLNADVVFFLTSHISHLTSFMARYQIWYRVPLPYQVLCLNGHFCIIYQKQI